MIRHSIMFARSAIAGTALTGAYQQIVAFADDLRLLMVFNSCDKPIFVSLDGGVTNHFEIETECFTIDFRALDMALRKPTISAKHSGVVPTSGSLRISGVQ